MFLLRAKIRIHSYESTAARRNASPFPREPVTVELASDGSEALRATPV